MLRPLPDLLLMLCLITGFAGLAQPVMAANTDDSLASLAESGIVTGQVIKVTASDVIVLLTPDSSQVKVRLYGIDSPEPGQAFSKKAVDFVSRSVFGKTVRVEVLGIDRYNRVLGNVLLEDGSSLNRAILSSGYAWYYEKYCKDADLCPDYRADADEARAAGRGLWADPNAISPWEFRKNERAQKPQVQSRTGRPSEIFSGRVIKVADGDTVTVLNSRNEQVKIRLYGVDCPEKSQAYGAMARDFTSGLVYGRDVQVLVSEKDRYGRSVAIIQLSDGRTLNAELVAAGLAWVYESYCKWAVCYEYRDRQDRARAEGRGLWAQEDPEAPWEYRRQEKQRRQK